MKYLKETLHWHFRIRIKRSFAFELHGEWRKVSQVHLQAGLLDDNRADGLRTA
jgi:hypothetical protein